MDRTQDRLTASWSGSRIGHRRRMFGAPRRGRWALPVTALALLAGIPLLLSALLDRASPPAAALERRGEAAAADDAGGAVGLAGAALLGGADPVPQLTPPVFATFEDLRLRLPSAQAVLVGFHEASQTAALPMVPFGRIEGNANTTRFQAPADVADGSPYVVMSSRGRPPAPTSAVDVLLRDDDPVLAPVSGRVTDVRRYQLYGKYPDHRIEIAPDTRPDLRVVMIHVRDVAVQPGDAVVAGTSVVAASANRFSFGSHIDRYTEPDRWPHVHLEVKAAETEPSGTPAPDG